MRKRVPAAGQRLADKGIAVEDTLNLVDALISFAYYSDWDKAVKAKMPVSWKVATELIDNSDTLEERALGYYLALYSLAGALDDMHAAFGRLAKKLLDVVDVEALLERDEILVRLLPFAAARLREEAELIAAGELDP